MYIIYIMDYKKKYLKYKLKYLIEKNINGGNGRTPTCTLDKNILDNYKLNGGKRQDEPPAQAPPAPAPPAPPVLGPSYFGTEQSGEPEELEELEELKQSEEQKVSTSAETRPYSAPAGTIRPATPPTPSARPTRSLSLSAESPLELGSLQDTHGKTQFSPDDYKHLDPNEPDESPYEPDKWAL